MKRIEMTKELRRELLGGVATSTWSDGYKLEAIEMIESIEVGTLIADERGALDVNGEIVDLADQPEDFVPHPVQLMEWFAIPLD